MLTSKVVFFAWGGGGGGGGRVSHLPNKMFLMDYSDLGSLCQRSKRLFYMTIIYTHLTNKMMLVVTDPETSFGFICFIYHK